MKHIERIFIIGFMGSDKESLARQLSEACGFEILYLDREIEKKDGRSIKHLCMTMGEHEYRNKEYELLQELCQRNNIIVICGDGVILDEMSAELLKQQKVYVADASLSVKELWQRAKKDTGIPYAFMLSSDEEEKYKKFCRLYEARKPLYLQFL